MGESGEPSITLGAGEGCRDGLGCHECEDIASMSQATGSTAADSPAAAPAQREQLPDALPMEQEYESNSETAHWDSTRSSVGAVSLPAPASGCEASPERDQGTGAHLAFTTAESSEGAAAGSTTGPERAPSMADRDSSAPEARSKQSTQAPVEKVCDLVVDMDAAAAAVSAALTGILGGPSRRGISSDGGVPLMRQSAAAGAGALVPPPPPPPRRSVSHMQSSQFVAMQQAAVFPQPHPVAPHLAFPSRSVSQQHPGMARSTSAVFRYRGGMPGARVSLVPGALGMGYEEPVSEGPRWRNSISGPMGDLGQVPYGTYQFNGPFAQPAPPPPPPPPPYRAAGSRALGHSQSLNDRSPRVQHVPGMSLPYQSIPGLLGGAHQGLAPMAAQHAPGVATVALSQQEPALHHAPLSAPLLSGGSMAGTLGPGQQAPGRGYTPTQMAQLLSLQAQALQAQAMQVQQQQQQQQRQLQAGLGLQHSASHLQQQQQQLNAIAAAAAAASQQQQQQLAAAIAAAAWQQQRLGTGDAPAGQAVNTTPSSPAVPGPSSGPLRPPVLSAALLDTSGLLPPGSHATPSPSASPTKEPSQASPGAGLSPGAEPAAPSRPLPLHLQQIWEGGPASCGSPAHSSVVDVGTGTLDPSSVLQPYQSALSAALSTLQLGRLPPAAAQQLLQEHELLLSLAGVVGDVFLGSGGSSGSSGGMGGSGGTASMPHFDAQGDVALVGAAAQRHVGQCSTLSEPFKGGLLALARVLALLSAECAVAAGSAAAVPEGQRQRQLQMAELHTAVCRVLHALAAADELFFASMAAVLPLLGHEGSGGGGSARGSSVGGSGRLPGAEEASERGSSSFPNTPTHKPGPASAASQPAAADRELARQLLVSLCALLSSAIEALQQRLHAHSQWSRGAQAQAHTLGADADAAAGLARQQLQQQQHAQVAEHLAANEAMRRFFNRSVSAPANRQPTPTDEATEHARVLTSLFNSITTRSARSSAPGESSDAAAGLSSLALAQLFGDDPEALGAAAAALSYSGSGADDAPRSEASASVLASFLESFTARSSSLGLSSIMERAASMDLQGFGPLTTPPRTSPANPLAMRAELAGVLGQHQQQQLQHAGQLGTAAAGGGAFPQGSATGVGLYGPFGVEPAGAGGGPLEHSAGSGLQTVRLHMPFGGTHASLSEPSHAHVHASALQAKHQQRQVDAHEAGPGELLSGSVAGGEALAALSSGELDVLQWDADTIQAAMRLLQGAGQLE